MGTTDRVLDTFGRVCHRLMLPSADYSPTSVCQRSCYAMITLNCLVDLLIPERRIPLRTHSVLAATVPPAAVVKHRDLCPREYDIWAGSDVVEADRKILSEPKATAVELATQCQLRFGVGAPVALH
jgi:hypothetical protein